MRGGPNKARVVEAYQLGLARCRGKLVYERQHDRFRYPQEEYLNPSPVIDENQNGMQVARPTVAIAHAPQPIQQGLQISASGSARTASVSGSMADRSSSQGLPSGADVLGGHMMVF